MAVKIKKERISKRTNRKRKFLKFIESGYTDYQAFLDACKNDENLLIYTCLTKEELKHYIDEMRKIEGLEDQLKYLINNQPIMNETVERFEKCTESIAKYLKGYVEYNGFRMNNSAGSYEDWTSEFWAKYCKICEFYKVRWFYPETLKKASTVSFSPMLYKEFIYICRMSITGERKHLAFLATQDQSSSLFNVSIDSNVDVGGDNEKTLAEVIPDEERNVEYLLDKANIGKILDKALEICKQYPDAISHYEKIKDFYSKQDTVGFDKKTVILGKIFLYKAGLVSPKTLAFIKSLSSTYKSRYNISSARVNALLQEYKTKKIGKTNRSKKVKKEVEGWRDLILRKRGEL